MDIILPTLRCVCKLLAMCTLLQIICQVDTFPVYYNVLRADDTELCNVTRVRKVNLHLVIAWIPCLSADSLTMLTRPVEISLGHIRRC